MCLNPGAQDRKLGAHSRQGSVHPSVAPTCPASASAVPQLSEAVGTRSTRSRMTRVVKCQEGPVESRGPDDPHPPKPARPRIWLLCGPGFESPRHLMPPPRDRLGHRCRSSHRRQAVCQAIGKSGHWRFRGPRMTRAGRMRWKYLREFTATSRPVDTYSACLGVNSFKVSLKKTEDTEDRSANRPQTRAGIGFACPQSN